MYVNTTTGNLVIQNQDELVGSVGLDLGLIRTYNSQGLFNDDNADNWRLGIHQRVYMVSGAVNAAGSIAAKLFGDGREVSYVFDAARGLYVSTEGDGAHDTLSYSSSTGQWTWTEGSSHLAETYDWTGGVAKLLSSRDADGNALTYGYSGDKLTTVTDASGQVTTLSYVGDDLTQISVSSAGVTQVRTRYFYDSLHRLTQVVVDLDLVNTPDTTTLQDLNGDGAYDTINSVTYVTRYTYDGTSKRVASITQGDGTVIGFTYELIDGQYRVTKYTEGGQGTIQLPRITSAIVTEETVDTPVNRTIDASIAAADFTQIGATQTLTSASEALSEPLRVKFDAAGNGYAIWREGAFNNFQTQGASLYVRRFDAATGVWGSASLLVSNSGAITAFDLSMDTQGNGVVAWTDNLAYGIKLRVVNAGSTTWGATQTVAGSEIFKIAVRGSRAVVGWTTITGPGYNNQMSVARFDGTTWQAPELVGQSSNELASKPSVGIDTNGNVMAAWQVGVSGQGYGTDIVHGRRRDAATGQWSAIANVMTNLLPSDQSGGYGLSLDADPNGNFVLLEQRRAAIYDAAAGQWQAFITTGAAGSGPGYQSFAMDAQGNGVLVYWGYPNLSPNSQDMWVRRYDPTTKSWGTPFQLTPPGRTGYGSVGSPAAFIRNGEAVVSWIMSESASGPKSLYFARSVGSTWKTSYTSIRDVSFQSFSHVMDAIGLDTQGNVNFAWWDSATTIKAARYSSGYAATIPADATWQSLAGTLYGDNSAAAGTALQTAMSNQALTAGSALRNLPGTLSFTVSTTAPVDPPYYLVPENATWLSVTQAVYGTTDANAVAALRSALGDPALVAGAHLPVPPSLSFNTGGRVTTISYASGTGSAPTAVTATANSAALSTTTITNGATAALNTAATTLEPAAWSSLQQLTQWGTNLKVAADPRGNVIATWNQSYSAYGQWVSRYDAVTSAWTTPLQVSTYTGVYLFTDAMRGASVAVDEVGNAVVAWIQRDNDAGMIFSIAAVTYDAATKTWTPPVLLERGTEMVNDNGTGDSLSTAINNGRVVVTWVATQSNGNNLLAARFDAGRWSVAEAIEDSGSVTPNSAKIALARNGNIIVAINGSNGTYYNSFDNATGRWSGAQLLVATPTNLFASDADGNLTVIYAQYSGGYSFFARKFVASSGTWGPVVTIGSAGSFPTLFPPSVSADAAGNILFAWIDYTGGANPIKVAKYTASAGTWSAVQTLESIPSGNNGTPLLTALNGSTGYLSWQHNSNGTNRWVLEGTTWTKLDVTSAVWAPQVVVDSLGSLTSFSGTFGFGVATLTRQTVRRYTIAAGDTWSSIAQTLYGSTTLADDLQLALGNPALVAGTVLRNLPTSLVDTTTTTVSPYYRVRAGETWSSLALAVYGTDDANAAAALRVALGSPTLATGLALSLPSTISYVPLPNALIARSELLATVETQNLPYTLDTSLLTTPPGGWAWSGPAQVSPWGPSQTDPALSFNASGNGVAVWLEGYQVRVSRYVKASGLWTPSVRVDFEYPLTAMTPVAAIDDAGNISVTWIAWNGTGYAFLANRFSASTQSWTGPQQLLVTSSSYGNIPVGALSLSVNAGRAAVSWVHSTGSQRDLYVARFDGSSWSSPQVLDNLANAPEKPSTAIDADGNISVVWKQYGSGPYHQYYSRYTAASSTWSTPAVLDTSSWAESGGIGFDAAGNGFAMWNDAFDVRVRRYDRATNTWSTADTIDSSSGGVETTSLSVDAAGNALVAWTQYDGGVRYFYANRFSATTLSWSGPVLLAQSNVIAMPNYGRLINTGLAGGKGAVSWLEHDGTRFNLNLRRFDGTQWLATELAESDSASVDMPALAVDSEGATTLFWRQNYKVTFNRYENDVAPYYLVPANQLTYRAITAALYGVDSVQAGNALFGALGNPAIQAGTRLKGLPANAVLPTQVNVPHYYTVQAGDTWLSIVQKVYGSSDPAAAARLQSLAGSPTLTAGLHVTTPLSLNYGVQPTTNGLQATITNALGQVTVYKHDTSGRLTATVSAIGIETDYLYDAEGNVSAIVEDATGTARVSTFEYANGNQIASRDSGGNTVRRLFNSRNQVVAEIAYVGADTDGAGTADQADAPLTTRYVYDNDDAATSEDHLRFTISAEGRVTEHRYNAAGQRVATLIYAGAQYAVAGLAATAILTEAQLVSWITSQDKTKLLRTDFAYDARGLLLDSTTFETTDSSGNGVATNAAKTQYVYDQRGQLLQMLDARGGAGTPNANNVSTPYATTFTYDGLGRMLTSTQWVAPGETRTTATQYDDVGNRTLTTLANSLVTTSVYDRAGLLLNVTASGTNVPAGSVTTYGYDDAGRLRAITDATGVSQRFVYDTAGRKVADIDGNGTLTEYVYDRFGKLNKTIRYADALTSATIGTLVDANGNFVTVDIATLRAAVPTTVGRASDQITRHIYDAAGRLVYTVDPTGAVQRQVFDGANRVTDVYRFAATAAIGAGVGEVTESTITALVNFADVNNRRTRNFYDGDGNLIATLDAEAYLVEYVRDAAGLLRRTIAYANQTIATWSPDASLEMLRPAADNETSIDTEQDIVTYFFYDGHGRQVGVLDGENYLTETVYTAAGQVDRTIRYGRHNPAGTDLGALVYQTNDTLATLKARVPAAALSHTTQYTYNGAGQLLTTTTFEGVVTAYAYDSVGALIATTAAQGLAEARTQQVRYDLLGRVIRELSGEGSAALAALGAGATQAQIDQVWDRYGVLYAYDRAGRRISATTRPYDATTGEQTLTTFFFYDEDSNLRFTVNARGERTERRYNSLGQVTEETSYSNRVSTTGLQGGLLTDTTLALLSGDVDTQRDVKTLYAYTLRGEVKSSVTAPGGSVTNTYNAFGELYTRISVDATQNALHRFTYDRRGLLKTTSWDPNGIAAQESRTYDAFGRLTSVQDQRSGIWRSEFDRLGRETATVDALFNRRVTTYDAFSRVLTFRDAMNNVTRYAYEVLDEQSNAKNIVVTTPENVSFTTYRNAHGEAVLVKDGRGVLTATQYDRNGAVVRITRNGVEQTFNTFDTEGRLLTTRDANGNTVTFTYDAANRVFTRTQRGSAGDPNLSLTTTYAYDGQGRVTDVTDPSGSVTHTDYDRDGRVIDVYEDYGAGRLNLRTHYDYDVANRTITTTQGYGATGPAFIPRVTRETYDALGRRISEVVDPGSGTNPSTGKAYLNLTTLFDYDRAGNLIRKRDANGRYTWYVYDADNRLTFVVDPPNDSVGAALYGRSSVTRTLYDAEDRVISERRFATTIASPGTTVELLTSTILGQLGAGTAQDQIETFVYDRDGRQTYSIDAGGTVTFLEYDGNGNVTRRTRYADRTTTSNLYTSASYNASTGVHTLYTSSGGSDTISPTAGQDRVSVSVYDGFDRKIYEIDALGGVSALAYDNDGNIVATTQYATQDTTVTAATVASWVATHTSANDRTTRYWYDGAGRVRFALDAEGWLVERRYDDLTRQDTELVYANKPTVTAGTTLAQLVTIAGNIDGDLDDQITVSQQDAAGRVVRVDDALGHSEYYGYDALGNRIWFTNAKGSGAQDVQYTWRFEYDANNRLVKEITPSVSVTSITTDGSGLHRTVASVALETVMTYDALGNLLARTEAANTSQARTTSYEYDSMGRQIVTRYPPAEIYDYNSNSVVLDSALYSATVYDALGNAIAGRDVAGNWSHKGYDTLGQVVWEVDAQRYLTFHIRDAFGNVTETRRFAAARDTSVGSATAPPITYPTNPAVGANDRVLAREYDKLDRVIRVIEPAGYVFDTNLSTGEQAGQATPQTVFLYDAFGNVVRESRLIHGVNAGQNPAGPDSNPSAWANTYRYYDRCGQLVAEVDPERYLTRFQYDETGDLIDKTEYAARVASVSLSAIPANPATTATSGLNRHTSYIYDQLNRLTSEFFTDVEYFNFGDPFAQSPKYSGTRSTSYGYDAIGNQTSVTVNNATTYSYYDVLGRVIAVAEPRRTIGHSQPVNPQPPTSLTPYTEMYRDAHGNIVEQIQYAGDIGYPSAGTKPTVSAALANDSRNRVTLTRYDLHGHIVETATAASVNGQAVDLNNAGFAIQHAAYTKRGEIAKQWQTITTVNPDTTPGAPATISETLSTTFYYDALGRQIKLVEPQTATRSRIVESDYNAFGEITERRTLNPNGVGVFGRETYEFDAAGRLWRTNADSGVYRIYLYDLEGRATAEIKAQTQDLYGTAGSVTLADVLAMSASSLMRSETVYDLLGRAVQQRGPSFELVNSAWAVSGSAQTHTYNTVDRWGNVTQATDELGRTTDYFYNQMDQVIRVVQPLVDVVETRGGIIRDDPDTAAPRLRPVTFNFYDLYGNLIGKTDAIDAPASTASTFLPGSGAPTYQIRYNEVGQVIQETADLGTKKYTLDRFGQRIQAVDEMGFKTRYQYDQFGNLVGLARERGSLAFDSDGFIAPTDFPGVLRPTTYTQATGYEVLRYSYDEAGRRIAETTGEFTGTSGNTQETIRYWYDLMGNLIRKREPIGQVSLVASDSSTVVVRYETTYEFDVNGNKIKETDGNDSWMTWDYDQFNRLRGHQQLTNANSWVAATPYGSTGDVITYNYDLAGLLDSQTSTFGQNIDYQYDAAGHLRRIIENSTARTAGSNTVLFGVDRDTDYRYDALGLRVGERTVIDNVTHQNAVISYDELDRLKSVVDLRSSVTYFYDARGNRTRVQETFLDQNSVSRSHEDWYVYDALNRVTTSGGADSHATIREVVINSTQGTELTYDLRGNRKTSREYGKRLTQHNDVDENGAVSTWYSEAAGYDEHLYFYDGESRVITDFRYMDKWVDGVLQVSGINGPYNHGIVADERYYDHASRQISQTTRSLADNALGFDVRTTATSYDDNGRVSQQTTGLNGLMESDVLYGTAYYDPGYYWPSDDGSGQGSYSPAGWRPGYDAAGVLRGYRLHAYPAGRSTYFTNHSFAYALADGYLEVAHTAQSTSTNGSPPPQPGSNKRVYNVNGEMVSYFDPADTSGANNRIFATNASGQVLTAVSGSTQYSANNAGVFVPLLSHYQGAGWSTGNAQLYRFAGGQYLGTFGTLQTGSFEANFDTNFAPISSNYPTAVPSQITIQSGDTLRSIAQRVFGDGNLWYVLADANGLTVSPDQSLDEQVGWSLRVPNEVISLSNNATSFRPFNVGDALGDTSPIQPAPPPPKAGGGGCGIIGQIIVIIVAIVVAYFTAGAALSVMGPLLSAAFGAAVGSVASQLVGMAIGVQEKFSWKAVAVAAVTAGLTKGIGVDKLSVVGSSADSVVNQAINGAISNAIGQGVNIAVGLQDKFSWRDLAVSAVAAPISARVSKAVGTKIDPKFGSENYTSTFGANVVSGLASGVSTVAVRAAIGGKVELKSALADVFGNALGNSLVEAIKFHGQVTNIASELGDRIGVDPNDPHAKAVLRRAAEIQLGRNASTNELRSLSRSYLELAGASQDEIDSTMALYEEHLFRRDSINTGTYEPPVAPPAEDMPPAERPPLKLTITEGIDSAAYGSARVDDLLIGAGEIGQKVGQYIESNPALKWGLVAIDVAAGPAAYVVRNAVLKTPIGDALESASAWALDKLSDPFENAGYDEVNAGYGGGGALTIGSVIGLGASVGLKVILRSGLAKRLMYVGRTPGKSSTVGLKVQAQMRADGKLIDGPNGPEFYSAKNQKWYPLKDADMSHKKSAVEYWNEEGRYHGARSPEVKKFMNDDTNYTLEHYSVNRSEGARMGVEYAPPATPEEIAEWLKRPR